MALVFIDSIRSGHLEYFQSSGKPLDIVYCLASTLLNIPYANSYRTVYIYIFLYANLVRV